MLVSNPPTCSVSTDQRPNPMKLVAALSRWSWRYALHHGETRLCISLPFMICFMASVARKRPEQNRDKTIYGVASIHLGHYQEAITSFQRAAELGEPLSALSLVYQAAAHQALGKSVRASEIVQELTATWPGFRPEVALPNFYQHREHADQILDLLLAAGWVPAS